MAQLCSLRLTGASRDMASVFELRDRQHVVRQVIASRAVGCNYPRVSSVGGMFSAILARLWAMESRASA